MGRLSIITPSLGEVVYNVYWLSGACLFIYMSVGVNNVLFFSFYGPKRLCVQKLNTF